MTPFPRRRYDPGDRGVVISKSAKQAYDFDRLERVVKALVAEHRRLRGANAGLRDELRDRNAQLKTLEGRLLEANQKRQDVAKRIDELIAQIGELDAHFTSVEP